MKIFSLDGPIQKYGSILFDMLIITTLWLVLSIASLTLLLPVATASLYYSLNHTIIQDDGYATRNFFTKFKSLFKRSLPVIVIFNLGLLMTGLNIWFVMNGVIPYTWLLPVYTFVFLEIGLVHTILFHLIAESDLKFKNLYKYSFMLAHKHMLTSIVCLVTTVALVVFSYVYINPIFFIIAAGFVFLLHSWLVGKRLLPRYDFSNIENPEQ